MARKKEEGGHLSLNEMLNDIKLKYLSKCLEVVAQYNLFAEDQHKLRLNINFT